jgi:heat shock protein HslJ
VANIEWVAVNGITNGCNPPTNTLFCPTNTVTRAQIAGFIYNRYHGTANFANPSSSYDPFTDDGNSAAVEWLAWNGITSGCTGTQFCQDDPVTREPQRGDGSPERVVGCRPGWWMGNRRNRRDVVSVVEKRATGEVQMKSGARLLLSAGLALAIGACGAEVASESTVPAFTVEGDWRIVGGVDLPPDTPVTVTISSDGQAGAITWSGACNTYSSQIVLEGSSFAALGISGTAAGCPEPYELADGAVESAVRGADRFELDGDRLRLLGAVDLDLERVDGSVMDAVVDRTWSLVAIQQEGESLEILGDTPTLRLSQAGEVEYGGGCDVKFGTWIDAGGAYFINVVDRAEGYCLDKGDQFIVQDSLIDAVISSPGSVEVGDDGSLVVTRRGVVLTYHELEADSGSTP